jgi:uncharacterized protein YjbI with pentapeptide repeats
MVTSSRAPVRPRVLGPVTGEAVLLEDEVARWLSAGAVGLIELSGPPGSGKTTALAHLAASLPPGSSVSLLDLPAGCAPGPPPPGRLTVVTACTDPFVQALGLPRLASYPLAGWGKDDFIEYLLATHPPRCASVLARVRTTDLFFLGGLPELWRVALDLLASDDALPDARAALHAHLASLLTDTDLLERGRSACLNAVLRPDPAFLQTVQGLARPGFGADLIRMLRHPGVQHMLAAERVTAELHEGADADFLACRLPRELVRCAATLLAGDGRALDHLRRLLEGPPWGHAMSASLLHAAGTGWAPRDGQRPALAGAYLDGAAWPGVQLPGADLTGTDLSGSDLSGANLTKAVAQDANFGAARLREAVLAGWHATAANLAHADLSGVRAEGASFAGASLAGAALEDACLRGADFDGADLAGADCRGADLQSARFASPDCASLGAEEARLLAHKHGARLEGADFTAANLKGAVLSGLRLGKALWHGVNFSGARLERCDLEHLTVLGADFREASLEGALLTGSAMPGACFAGARLCGAGLADVDWEGADLRDADLCGADFHLGSSRSGLVGSTIACEGSRTGFYTDDYDDQGFKAPEEIRKANLCGADLRGARVEEADFYLVDLRGALYDPHQAEHFRRCGAILDPRA